MQYVCLCGFLVVCFFISFHLILFDYFFIIFFSYFCFILNSTHCLCSLFCKDFLLSIPDDFLYAYAEKYLSYLSSGSKNHQFNKYGLTFAERKSFTYFSKCVCWKLYIYFFFGMLCVCVCRESIYGIVCYRCLCGFLDIVGYLLFLLYNNDYPTIIIQNNLLLSSFSFVVLIISWSNTRNSA